MSLLPSLPEMPRTRLAVDAAKAMMDTLFMQAGDALDEACERADRFILRLEQSKSPEERAFAVELSDWLARAV